MMGMAEPDPLYSKRDLDRLLRDLVPPIATETARAVATETARAVTTELTKTLSGEISRGVTEAMANQFRVLGIETTSAEAISRQHRRNQFIDDCIANRTRHDERMRALDEMARDFDPEDRTWVKDARRRHERDGNVLRETFIRWLVPVVMGFVIAALGFKLVEGRASTPVTHERRDGGTPPAIIAPNT